MQLPSRLRTTTLGDVLGTIYRAGATGTLEIVELVGRTHRVHVACGLVTAVEIEGASTRLSDVLRRSSDVDATTLQRSLVRAIATRRLHGEVLVSDFRIDPSVVDRALRQQVILRLHLLEGLAEAGLRFRVTVRSPRSALTSRPVEPREFLIGRRRARDRAGTAQANRPAPRATAWRVLGVSPGTGEGEIRRAYRELARRFHPDLHPDANDDERQRLAERFAEATAAYRALVA